jgi:hypothetical protein
MTPYPYSNDTLGCRHWRPRDEFLKQDRNRDSVESRKAERALLFWTIRQSCFVVLLAAGTVYTVVSLLTGQIDGPHLVGQILARAAALGPR